MVLIRKSYGSKYIVFPADRIFRHHSLMMLYCFLLSNCFFSLIFAEKLYDLFGNNASLAPLWYSSYIPLKIDDRSGLNLA